MGWVNDVWVVVGFVLWEVATIDAWHAILGVVIDHVDSSDDKDPL